MFGQGVNIIVFDEYIFQPKPVDFSAFNELGIPCPTCRQVDCRCDDDTMQLMEVEQDCAE